MCTAGTSKEGKANCWAASHFPHNWPKLSSCGMLKGEELYFETNLFIISQSKKVEDDEQLKTRQQKLNLNCKLRHDWSKENNVCHAFKHICFYLSFKYNMEYMLVNPMETTSAPMQHRFEPYDDNGG